MRAMICLIILIALSSPADTARWPQRIVETRYTVNSMTGSEYGHTYKERYSVVAVDISKLSVDGKDMLKFKRRVTKSMMETESETGEVTIPFDHMAALSTAVRSAISEMSRLGSSGDMEDTLFSESGLDLILTRDKRRMYLRVKFNESDCEFRLERVHTKQFFDLLRSLS